MGYNFLPVEDEQPGRHGPVVFSVIQDQRFESTRVSRQIIDAEEVIPPSPGPLCDPAPK